MQISTINNVSSFKGQFRKSDFEEVTPGIYNDPGKLSPRSVKLIKNLNDFIENKYTENKENGNDSRVFFVVPAKRGKEVAYIEPIYGGNEPTILIDVTDEKFSHKIYFNRKNPKEFRYEKTVETKCGYATLKTFDSRYENNPDVLKYVEEKVQYYVPGALGYYY